MLNKERALYHCPCPSLGSCIGGFPGIRENCHLQQSVNKVVPNIENPEAGRRKAFYEGPCKEDEGILENDKGLDNEVKMSTSMKSLLVVMWICSNLEEGTCENNNKLPEDYGAVAMEMDRFAEM